MLEPNAEKPRLDTASSKVLAALELLALADSQVGVTAAAKSLDIDKAGIHRLFNTLVDLGYAIKNEDAGRYTATLKLWEIGSAVVARHPAKRAAQPMLRMLRQQTNESPFLSMLCGDEVLYLDRLDSPYPLVASVAIGRRTPAHQVASGKAMLAFQPDIADILLRLEQRGKTTEEVQAIALELATVRQRGFATSSNASVAGMTAVAAPVQSRFGPPKFAIGVGGVSDRFGAEQLEQVVRAVMNAALGISEALGEA